MVQYIQALPQSLVLAFALAATSLVASGCTSTAPASEIGSQSFSSQSLSEAANTANSLTVVSLNVAHGRADSFNQMFLSKQTIEQNLLNVAEFLRETQADIVALQELDGPSAWSGKFSHDQFIAENAGFAHAVRSDYVNKFWGQYGSGVLSNLPITDSFGVSFAPSFPTPSKGFVLTEILWQTPQGQSQIIDVVSVHLDFSRSSVRKQQIEQLKETLLERDNPKIIMGDFNSDWLGKELTLKSLAQGAQVHTFQPDSTELVSYGSKRLDWILLSPELEFLDYQHSDTVLSDHKAVIAKIHFKPTLELSHAKTP